MATANPYTSASAPMSMIAPDLAAQQIQLARQQQLADLLRQQSITPMGDTQVIDGFAVRKTPFEGIAKIAQALSANYAQKNVDEKNLDLATSMRQRMADILGGQSSNPTGALAAGAAAQPSTPGADGEMVNQGGVGPTTANAQRLTAAPPANNNFSMGNLVRGSVISDIGGPAAGAAYYKQFEPTDLQRNDTYLGIGQDQSRQAELAKRLKEGNIPPTRLGNAGYFDPHKGFVPLPAQPAAGTINMPTPDTPSGFTNVGVTNALPGIAAAAAASSGGTAGGKAPFQAPISLPMSDGRTLSLSVPEYAEYQKSGVLPSRYSQSPSGVAPPQVQPQPGVSGNFKGDPARAQADITAMKDPQERANAQAAFDAQMKATNGTLPPMPSASAAPVVGMTPPLGTTANADAAQKSSAQTMQASYAKLQGSNSTAQNALDVIDKMQAIAAKKNALLTAGVLGTNQSAVNPDAAEYEKQRANLITQLAAQNGTNGTDAGRALTGEAVPDFGKPKAAIADGLGTLRNQTVVQQLKANLLTPVYQSGDSKKYTTLENEFDQHISPSMVPLLTMPAGKARAEKLQAATKDPAMRAKLNWAAENGLLK